jgi:hypothetical protein
MAPVDRIHCKHCLPRDDVFGEKYTVRAGSLDSPFELKDVHFQVISEFQRISKLLRESGFLRNVNGKPDFTEFPRGLSSDCRSGLPSRETASYNTVNTNNCRRSKPEPWIERNLPMCYGGHLAESSALKTPAMMHNVPSWQR